MLNGEVISPPAGAIGRGDAFVLRIAERTGATVLSNDSFQEFHGEHPWLFDDGRLIGGKPVPGVGWIYTPRLPIRGPKSRAATAEARAKNGDHASAPAKAAELARAAKKAAKRAGKSEEGGRRRQLRPSTVPGPSPRPRPAGKRQGRPRRLERNRRGGGGGVASREARREARQGSSRKQAAAKKAAPPKSAKAKKDASGGKGHDGKGPRGRGEETADQQGGGSKQRKKRSAPPPAVNEPLDFINFVAAYPVGSTIDGEVVSFTSHGAMVDVPLPSGGVLHCYIPLSAMGTPAPTKARQVLKKGEVRPFVLAGLDPPRRVAELALTTSVHAQKKRGELTEAPPSTPAKKSAKRAKAARTPAPDRATGEKAGRLAKKAVKKQTKTAAAANKAPARPAPAKKAAKTKKTGKVAAAKAPAKKSAKTASKAKKAPAKKAAKGRA